MRACKIKIGGVITQSINLIPYKIRVEREDKKRKIKRAMVMMSSVLIIILLFCIPYIISLYYESEKVKENKIYNVTENKYKDNYILELNKEKQYAEMVEKLKAQNKLISTRIEMIKNIIPDNCIIQSIDFKSDKIDISFKSSSYTEIADIITRSKYVKSIKDINYGIIKFVNDGYAYNIELLLKEK